jgi:hypothetical protein
VSGVYLNGKVLWPVVLSPFLYTS